MMGLVFWVAGKIAPSSRIWDKVDSWYYPIALVGLILFFASNSTKRHELLLARSLESAHQTVSDIAKLRYGKTPEKAAILAHVVSQLPDRIEDKKCKPNDILCTRLATLRILKPKLQNLVESQRFGVPDICGVVSAFSIREQSSIATDLATTTRLSPIPQLCFTFPEYSNYKHSNMETVRLLVTGAIRARYQATKPPTSRWWIIQAWLWPFALALAIALKIGKTSAGRKKEKLV